MKQASDDDPGRLVTAALHRRFDRAARSFERSDFVFQRARDGLMERISPVVVDAACILDLGCATGRGSRMLSRKYRKSRIVSIDQSAAMLARCKSDRPWLSKRSEVRGDALHLPFRAGSIDIVFANLLLPWIDDQLACLREVARVLRKDGLFAFSTLGPDSFDTLRDAWRAVDDTTHVRRFEDMHDTGDALLHAGLRDPVLDVDYLDVSYADPDALFRDLSDSGARNSLAGRRGTLTGKARLEDFRRALFGEDGATPLHVNIELVFGHAWGGGQGSSGEYRIDPASIPRRRRLAE